jgi:hypothetical protein
MLPAVKVLVQSLDVGFVVERGSRKRIVEETLRAQMSCSLAQFPDVCASRAPRSLHISHRATTTFSTLFTPRHINTLSSYVGKTDYVLSSMPPTSALCLVPQLSALDPTIFQQILNGHFLMGIKHITVSFGLLRTESQRRAIDNRMTLRYHLVGAVCVAMHRIALILSGSCNTHHPAKDQWMLLTALDSRKLLILTSL